MISIKSELDNDENKTSDGIKCILKWNMRIWIVAISWRQFDLFQLLTEYLLHTKFSVSIPSTLIQTKLVWLINILIFRENMQTVWMSQFCFLSRLYGTQSWAGWVKLDEFMKKKLRLYIWIKFWWIIAILYLNRTFVTS